MYQHGEYSKEKRKYYNADTGKWIGRILPSMVEKRKGIRVYDFNIPYDDYFSIRLIPRVKYFLTYVYRRMIDEERSQQMWVYISSNFQRAILSNDFKDVIAVLEDIGCLHVDMKGVNPYDSRKKKIYFKIDDRYFDSVDSVSKIYNQPLYKSLRVQYRKIVSPYDFLDYEVNVFKNNIGVLDHSFEGLLNKRIGRKQSEERGKYFWDTLSKSVHSQISKSVQDGKYVGWTDVMIRDYKKRFKQRYDSLIESIKYYDDVGNIGSVKVNDFAGRVYNPIIQKDKEFRSFISIDGEDCVEVDMVTGYASLMYVILDSLNTGKSDLIDYNILDRCWNKEDDMPMFYVKDFLDTYRMCFGKGSIDFYHYVGVRIVNSLKDRGVVLDPFVSEVGSLIQKREYRNYIKDLIIKLINSNPDHFKNHRFIGGNYTFSELSDIVFTPGVSSFLNHIKSNPIYSDVKRKLWVNSSKMVMKQEVYIMREIQLSLMDSNIPYVSLHDGVLVGRSRLPLVQNIIDSVVSKYRFVQFKYKL